MSPLSKLTIIQIMYKIWIRELIIDNIQLDYSYQKLLNIMDIVTDYSNRKDGDQWVGKA